MMAWDETMCLGDMPCLPLPLLLLLIQLVLNGLAMAGYCIVVDV